jgi:tRNA nucleotidyltransferase (CCA-adding enzyme)
MKELDLKPGRVIGQILERLVELVTDDPSANERSRLLDAAKGALADLGGAGQIST